MIGLSIYIALPLLAFFVLILVVPIVDSIEIIRKSGEIRNKGIYNDIKNNKKYIIEEIGKKPYIAGFNYYVDGKYHHSTGVGGDFIDNTKKDLW